MTSKETPGAGALETAYVPAPDHPGTEGEAKLLVTSPVCCKRNKMGMLPFPYGQICYKPTSLSSLDNDLYQRFLKDLHISTSDHRDVWNYVISWYLCLIFLPPLPSWGFALCALGVFLVVAWCHSVDQEGIQCVVEARVSEWLPLFQEQGYTVDYVIDRPNWWTWTETYVHFHQSIGLQQEFPRAQEEEAKYLILFPPEIRRRNKTFRRLGERRAPLDTRYLKPPALRHLDGAVFREILKDIEAATTMSNFGNFLFFCGVVAFVSLLFLQLEKIIAFSVLGLLLLIHLCVGLYTDLISSLFGVPSKVEELKPRLEEHGFTLSYHVDQPAWWAWREYYVLIQRLPSRVVV